jgi:uncharacterized membrane protein
MRFSRRHVWIILALSFAGFLDASYLAAERFLNRIPPCSLIKGCEVVTTSSYSAILGVPVSLLGALYYLAMLLAAVWVLDKEGEKVARYLAWGTIVGASASVWFVYVQVGILGAVCIYCMASAAVSLSLFGMGMRMFRAKMIK